MSKSSSSSRTIDYLSPEEAEEVLTDLIMNENVQKVHNTLQQRPYAGKSINDPLFLGGEPIIHIAVRLGSRIIVRYAAEQGADINIVNKKGWSPVMTAEYWINEWKKREVPVLASRCSRVRCWLLQHGGKGASILDPEDVARMEDSHHEPRKFDWNKSSQTKDDPNKSVVPDEEMILPRDPKFRPTIGSSEEPKVERQRTRSPPSKADMIQKDALFTIHRRLHDAGQSIHSPIEGTGKPLLHLAAAYGNINVMRYAMEAGADINQLDEMEWSPVKEADHYAEVWSILNKPRLSWKCEEALQWLIDHGGRAIGGEDTTRERQD